MLEIVRGRAWSVVHTVTEDGAEPSDLSLVNSVRCQIRGKTATRNAKGYFELPLVMEVTAALSGEINELLTLSLDAATADLIPVGDYLIDAVGVWDDTHEEPLLPCEAIRVVNFPTRTLTP